MIAAEDFVALRQENDALRERVTYLEELLAPPQQLLLAGRKHGLPPRICMLAHMFTRRQFVSRRAVYHTLDQLSPFSRGSGELSIPSVNVAMHHFRKFCKLHGVVLKRIYGHGWEIAPSSQRRLEDLLGGCAHE